MNSRDPHHEIAELLRSHKPSPASPPGLESRILRALHERQRPPARRFRWPWLLLPPAVAAAVVVVLRAPSPSPTTPAVAREHVPLPAVSLTPDTSIRPSIEPAISLIVEGNPLNAETAALGRDARRAGSFLIDCLPSIASRGE